MSRHLKSILNLSNLPKKNQKFQRNLVTRQVHSLRFFLKKRLNRPGKRKAFKEPGTKYVSQTLPLNRSQSHLKKSGSTESLMPNHTSLTQYQLIQQQLSSATSIPRNGFLFNPAQSTNNPAESNSPCLPI